MKVDFVFIRGPLDENEDGEIDLSPFPDWDALDFRLPLTQASTDTHHYVLEQIDWGDWAAIWSERSDAP